MRNATRRESGRRPSAKPNVGKAKLNSMTPGTFTERLQLATQGQPYGFQAALAKACGVRASSVNDWMTGKTRMIAGDLLYPLARFLDISPEWLATGRGPMHPEREGTVKADIAPERASQSGRLDPETLRQAMLFTRTFLAHGGEAPDLEGNAAYVAAAYEGIAEANAAGLDQVAFMARMLAKLQGVRREVERQTDRTGRESSG